MTALFPRLKMRAVIGLIAAYAVALQAVFTTLAPMPVHAAGNVDPFAHCFGTGSPGGEPGAPLPASGKMHCVFCGTCAGGFVVLPAAAIEARPQAAAPVAFVLPASADVPVAGNARDGPARAPPLTL